MKKRMPIALGTSTLAFLMTGVLAGLLAISHHIAKYSLTPPEMFGFFGMFIAVALMAGFVSLVSCILAGCAVLATNTANRQSIAFGGLVGFINACILELFTIVYQEQYLIGILTLTIVGASLSVAFFLMNRNSAQQGGGGYGSPGAGSPSPHR